MEVEAEDESGRIAKCLTEVSKRVESLRDQALALEKEKKSLLELLQNLQDTSGGQNLSAGKNVISFRGLPSPSLGVF